jgi:hypothetical protein
VGGIVGWLLRVLGIGGRRSRPAPAGRPPARVDRRSGGRASATAPVGREEFRLARRRVIAYVAQARAPIRQAAAVRQAWLADLSKVYAEIASSPTARVLERAGAVGQQHEPAFRDALAHAQAIDPPIEADEAHAALVGWLTCLHAACLALIDARKLRDRAMLGTFREQLGQARRLAAQLVHERGALFTAYRLTVRASIKAKRPLVLAAPADGARPAPRGRRGGASPDARDADSARPRRPAAREGDGGTGPRAPAATPAESGRRANGRGQRAPRERERR